MADPARSGPGSTDPIRDALARVNEALRELRSASGTQRVRAVEKLEETVAALEQTVLEVVDLQTNLEARMTAFIENDVQAIVDAAVEARLAGNVTIGGNLTLGGGFTAPQIYSNSLASDPDPRAVMWVDSTGSVGTTL